MMHARDGITRNSPGRSTSSRENGRTLGRCGPPTGCSTGGGIRLLPEVSELKQAIRGGNDVLDLRTCPRFQQGQRVDQHPLIW